MDTNLDNDYFWFDCLILMFQKEVANRIIAKFNTPEYGRLSILANWKLNIEKICDIKPLAFFQNLKLIAHYYILSQNKDIYILKTVKMLKK